MMGCRLTGLLNHAVSSQIWVEPESNQGNVGLLPCSEPAGGGYRTMLRAGI